MQCYEREAMCLQLIRYMREVSPDCDANPLRLDTLSLDVVLSDIDLESYSDMLELSSTERAELTRRALACSGGTPPGKPRRPG